MSAQKTTIEFLPQDKWEKTISGKILKWILTIGRHIAILTELVVILCFLSRFKLDRDLADLKDEIKQKVTIVETTLEFEKDFRFIQQRLDETAKLETSQVKINNLFEGLENILPQNAFLSKIKIEGSNISCTATAPSETELAILLANLKRSSFKEFSLSNVNLKTSAATNQPEINFNLEAKAKKE